MDTAPDDIVIPALLRVARRAYGHAVRELVAEAGFDDMPRNGPFVLGGMANRGGTAAGLIRELGITKQAASQLIDTLVLRGYLEREVNADDRRSYRLRLTEAGQAAHAKAAALFLPALAAVRAGLGRDEGAVTDALHAVRQSLYAAGDP